MFEMKDDRSFTQDELIKNLLFYDWSSEGEKINKTFLILLNAYLGSEPCDSAEPGDRQEIAFHLVILQETIKRLKHLEILNIKKTA